MESAQRTDIATTEDIRELVESFYTSAFRDELLGPVFTDVAQMDLAEHMPTMIRFWSTVLLGARSYGGGAFKPHAELHAQVTLTRQHFDRWLAIWRATVDRLHEGPVAEDAKFRAERVADAFHARLNHPERSGFTVYQYDRTPPTSG